MPLCFGCSFPIDEHSTVSVHNMHFPYKAITITRSENNNENTFTIDALEVIPDRYSCFHTFVAAENPHTDPCHCEPPHNSHCITNESAPEGKMYGDCIGATGNPDALTALQTQFGSQSIRYKPHVSCLLAEVWANANDEPLPTETVVSRAMKKGGKDPSGQVGDPDNLETKKNELFVGLN